MEPSVATYGEWQNGDTDWRWKEGELRSKRTWMEEDRNLFGIKITRRALENSMQKILG